MTRCCIDRLNPPSHRLLVHGIRIPPPDGLGERVIAGDGRTAGMPWWAIGFIGASAVTAYLLFVPPKSKQRQKGTGAVPILGCRPQHDAVETNTDLTPNDQETRA